MSHSVNKGGGSEGSMCLRRRNGGKVKPDIAYCAFPSNQFLDPFSTIMSPPLLLLWDLYMQCMLKHWTRPHKLSHIPDTGCESLNKRSLIILTCNPFLKWDIWNHTITWIAVGFHFLSVCITWEKLIALFFMFSRKKLMDSGKTKVNFKILSPSVYLLLHT